MLPRLTPELMLTPIYQEYLDELRSLAPHLEVNTDYAARLAVATDNSIYQVIPQAVIFPCTTQDIALVLQLAHQEKFHPITFCPRGGGTSTNGQSLSSGIILDCSRSMRDILEINQDENWVRVQPGVILDQLNSYLKEYGFCFAPEISPSNRATIGGMVNTDASGTGSRILGRTSDNVIDLTCVLSTGRIIHSGEESEKDSLYQQVLALIEPYQHLVDEKFTSAPRTLNGYNLKKASLSPNYLFCGSEGTLAIISECKLKLTPIPKYKKLIVVKYRSFDDALRAAEITESIKPLAIEAIDEKLIDLARQDSLYLQIKDFIDNEHTDTRAINLVEFVADELSELEKTLLQFIDIIRTHQNKPQRAIGYYVAKNAEEAKLLWELRKKSVGLISKEKDGTRRPIPFIEDTAVPPEKLADYIQEFKALLDQHHLHYGMYGHIDAGCVHVRPALDMKLAQDEKLMLELSNQVVALINKYNGVLWGEHGQGHRTVFSEQFFGRVLYYVIRQIKTLFDPHNQLNPGKVAIALDTTQTLVKLDGPLRGQYDKQIAENTRADFAGAMACNGNGACFNYATADVMCPSYKVTQDRIHSPKGRATIMREWLRELANKNFQMNTNKKGNVVGKLLHLLNRKPDFSHEVQAAFAGCLSCKACAVQCPLTVDVPEFKAKFLAVYYQRYFRSPRDYLIGSLEKLTQMQAIIPRLSNWFIQKPFFQSLVRKLFKMVDVPQLGSLSITQELKQRNTPIFDVEQIKKLSEEDKSKSVILLQDTFTSFYEPEVLLSIYDVLTKIGYTVYVAPFFVNGKPWHVRGFLKKFVALVKKNTKRLQMWSELNIPLVGIDPSMTLTYRDEYQKVVPDSKIHVLLLQEWFMKYKPTHLSQIENQHFYYLAHCTEKTMVVETEKYWQDIFASFGLTLTPLQAGCCGMAGSYGHESEHVEDSRALFKMDWQRHLVANEMKVLATGYSCRSQAARLMGIHLQHPFQVLSKFLN